MSKWNCLRADSRLSPIQWETSLQSNAVSHWLCANLESALSPAAYINPSQYSHVIPSDMISVILQHADTIRIDSWSTMRTFQSFVLCARMTSCTISAMANNKQLEFESSIHGWEYRPLWHCQYKKKLSYQNRTRNCYYKDKIDGSMQEWRKSSELALSFLAGCPKSHFLGWNRNFLVYWYSKLDNQVVNSTCPEDKLGWIWRADDSWCRTLQWSYVFLALKY